VTIAAKPHPGTAPRRNAQNAQAPRKEVTTMIRKLKDVLIFNPRPAIRDKSEFNARLLEQRREDIYLAMHQMGLLR